MNWNFRNRTPGHVIQMLIDKAFGLWCSHPVHEPYKKYNNKYMGNPGDLVINLPEKDRELLKNLTAKDFDHRLDVTPFLYGSNATGEYKSRYSKALEEQRATDKKTR